MTQMNFTGKTVVITGASTGIGLGYAHEFAKRGANLVLVARNKDLLETVAADIKATENIKITTIALDLSSVESGQKLMDMLGKEKLTADVLVNNAGFGTNTRVAKEDRKKIQQEIVLNVATLVDLTTAVIPGMLDRDFGVVINIASTASYQPVPGMAVYAATKAFVRSFTEALWGELQGTNVRALTVSPGATKTEFFNVAGFTPPGGMAPVSDVVKATFVALDSKTSSPSIIVGGQNSMMANITRFAPTKTVIKIAGKMFLKD
jgi:short-subunit dehydrogenase